MLIFAVALLGVVALPFLILLVPVLLWLLVPTAVVLGVGYAIKAVRHRHPGLFLPERT